MAPHLPGSYVIVTDPRVSGHSEFQGDLEEKQFSNDPPD